MHGKHVLCEKPFTLDRAEAQNLADLARERGLACAVGMVRRFSRSACLLGRLLSQERPTRLVWHEGGPFRWPVASPAYFAPEAGNSLLWDVGSHVVDLLIWWLGAPAAVTCRDDAMGGTATNCVLELAWADGCSGEVGLSREYDLPGGLVVERTSGVLACRDVAEADVLCAPDEAAAPDFQHEIPGSRAPAGRTFLDCFDLQLRNVLAAVRGAAPLWVPAHDVIESVGAVAAADGGKRAARVAVARPARARHRPSVPSRRIRGGEVLRVAVIGANGFVGSRLVEQWHLEGRAEIVPVVRRPEAAASALRFALDCRVADALDERGLACAFAGCDAVVHAAAGGRRLVTQSPARVARAAAEAGARIVIYLSSMAVHGWDARPGTDEATPLPAPPPGPVQRLEGPRRACAPTRLPRDGSAVRDPQARDRLRAALAMDRRLCARRRRRKRVRRLRRPRRL